jgi:hypothetical protein
MRGRHFDEGLDYLWGRISFADAIAPLLITYADDYGIDGAVQIVRRLTGRGDGNYFDSGNLRHFCSSPQHGFVKPINPAFVAE